MTLYIKKKNLKDIVNSPYGAKICAEIFLFGHFLLLEPYSVLDTFLSVFSIDWMIWTFQFDLWLKGRENLRALCTFLGTDTSFWESARDLEIFLNIARKI